MNKDAVQELRAIFREEAAELLGELRGLLGAMRGATQATFEQQLSLAMRLAHNLKGSAGNVGLSRVEHAAHTLEDAFLTLRHVGQEVLDELVPLLGAVLSGIELTVEEKGEAFAAEHEAKLAAWVALTAPSEPQEASAQPDTGKAHEAVRAQAHDLLGDVAGEGANVPRVEVVKGRTIRIEAERLDKLLELVSSLLVAETDLRQRHGSLEALREQLDYRLGGGTQDAKGRLDAALRTLDTLILENRNAVGSFGRLSQELHSAMKRARMVPLSSLSAFLQRSAADAGRHANKSVDLELQLSDVELDKVILDNLRDPLMHLLRNAVDHGLESADSRDLMGKPARGLVRVSAELVGASVRIMVSDDGRGIDEQGLAAAVVRLGLLSTEQVDMLAEESLVDLIFAPGLSTRRKITHLSGRGVGLDVVRSAVLALGGSVRAHARGPLGGAAFVLTLPLSLLSTRLLLVAAGDSVYAFPVEAIERVQRVSRQAVSVIDGIQVVQLDAMQWLRVVGLSTALSGRRPREQEQFKVLIVSQGEKRFAIAVDEVLREEELVVRKLPWNMQSIAGVSGATVLADGSVAAVVDVSQLAEGKRPDSSTVSRSAPEGAQKKRAQILVVDDSMTTRTLHRNVLSFVGYQVQTAHDGSEAWALMQSAAFDAVVSDVQMPGLDGFELTRKIRADSRFKQVKIILVTSLDSPEDRQRGMHAGADGYVVKGPLERDALLAAVAQQLGS